MENEIKELEATGATELAGKFREAYKTHATAHDTLKAEHAAATAKVKAAEREAAKYKADFEASGKTTDERVTALSKDRETLAAERDSYKTAAEQRAADLESHRLRAEVADELFSDIADKRARKRAVDVFLTEYRPEGAGLDAKGKLQGFEAALASFKTTETWAYASVEAPHGGGRAGGDPTAKATAKGGEGVATQALLKRAYPNDFKKGA